MLPAQPRRGTRLAVPIRRHAEGGEEAGGERAVREVEVAGVERGRLQGEVGGGRRAAVLVLDRCLWAGVLGEERAVAVQVVEAHLRKGLTPSDLCPRNPT